MNRSVTRCPKCKVHIAKCRCERSIMEARRFPLKEFQGALVELNQAQSKVQNAIGKILCASIDEIVENGDVVLSAMSVMEMNRVAAKESRRHLHVLCKDLGLRNSFPRSEPNGADAPQSPGGEPHAGEHREVRDAG